MGVNMKILGFLLLISCLACGSKDDGESDDSALKSSIKAASIGWTTYQKEFLLMLCFDGILKETNEHVDSPEGCLCWVDYMQKHEWDHFIQNGVTLTPDYTNSDGYIDCKGNRRQEFDKIATELEKITKGE